MTEQVTLEMIRRGEDAGRLASQVEDTLPHPWYGRDLNAILFEEHGFDALPWQDPAFRAGYRAGQDGLTWEWPVVEGYRYGDIPTCGHSANTRDECPELGVSLAALDGQPEIWSFAVAGAAARRRVHVRGILLPWRGSDGEPLVVGAVEV